MMDEIDFTVAIQGGLRYLVPATKVDAAKVAKYHHNDVVTYHLKRHRSGKHHRYVFALLNFVYDNQEYFNNGNYFKDLDALRRWLTLQTSFCFEDVDPITGELYRVPKSWSYVSLDEDSFAQLHSELNNVAIKHFFKDWDGEELEYNVNLNQAQEGLVGFL